MWVKIPKSILENRGNELSIGTYQIIINPRMIGIDQLIVNIINSFTPITKHYGEKRYVIQRAFKENGNIGIQIEIFENPIPILVILSACGMLLGGLLVWQVLVEIRKLINPSTFAGKMVILLGVAILGLYFWKKRKRIFK